MRQLFTTLLLIISLLSAGCTNEYEPAAPTENLDSNLEVHFIDVGQADSALVLCDDQSLLIDGGNAEDSSLIYSYLKKREIKNLNYIVCTHAHEDHCGGLAGALEYATVETVFAPTEEEVSKVYTNFLSRVKEQGVEITTPSSGDSFTLGSANVEIVGPVKEYDDTNNTSIVLRIVYGDTAFLFTGDAERESEQDIIDAGYELESTVLKVGHHGSNTSTSYPFLREVAPKYAVISVGTGNSYGHPTEDTLSKLRDAEVTVYRTDLQGTIVAVSNGSDITFTTDKNSSIDTLQLPPNSTQKETNDSIHTYVLNTRSKKFHLPDCSGVKSMSEKNKQEYTGNRSDLITEGYSPCENCEP